MANKSVNYDINFNVDMSSLELLKEALNNIQTMSSQYYIKLNGGRVAEEQLRELKQTASQVEIAMDAAFNPKLNTLNFTQFNDVLKASGLNIQKIEQQFNTAGDVGKRAFRNLTEQILTANTQLRQTKSFIQNIGETLFNAAKWSVAYGAINNITNGIKSAWTYAISLDSALNDIRIVTGKSYEEMEKFAKSANKAAKTLGTSTTDYTKGSLIYYQQGLSQKEVEARTAVSAKTANVTGQSMQEVSEELTAVWNGFQVTAQDAESYVDRLAAVAAASASDLEELSTAMSRVASSANTMGINIDQLTAQIATIESVTRQDAASIGTALKTIYSRMGDLAIGTEDEFGVALGDVSGKMKQMGIDILDQSDNMRNMGTIIEEVAAKWDTWTSAQQQAAAVALAGKRQYNNLFALFENWDMYEANKTVSENSIGELQKQQDTYMESTRAHMEQMRAAAEGLKDALFDNKGMSAFYDGLKFGLEQLTSLVNGLGGASNILLGVFSYLGNKLNNEIGQGLGNAWIKLKSINEVSVNQQAQTAILAEYSNAQEDTIKKMVSLEEDKLKYSKILNDQEKERYNLMIKQTNELATQKDLIKASINRAGVNLVGTAKNVITNGLSAPIRNAKGRYDQIDLDSLSKMSDADKQIILNNVKNERKDLQKRQQDLNTSFSNVGVKNALQKGATQTERDKATTSIGKLRVIAQQQLDTNLNRDSEAYKNIAMNLNHLNELEKTYGELKADNKDVNSTALQLSKDLTKAQNEEALALNNIDDAISLGIPKYQAAAEAQESLNKEQQKMADENLTKQKIANITQVTSALMQLAMTVISLTNLFDSYFDEEVSVGEKIKQTVMVVLSLAPMIISVAKVLHTQLVAQAKATGAEVTASLGWIGVILTIITVIIALGVAVANHFLQQETALEKAQKAYEKANEELQAMQENLKQLNSAYEELTSTISKYQDARNGIDQLKTGTEEFTDAIIAANEQAISLIQKYELLDEYYTIDPTTGLINITDAGLDAIKKEQRDAIAAQQRDITLKNLDVKNKKEDLSNKEFFDYYIKDVAISNTEKLIIDRGATANKKAKAALDLRWAENTDADQVDKDGGKANSKLKYYYNQALKGFEEQGSKYFLSEDYNQIITALTQSKDTEKERIEAEKELRQAIEKNIITINSNSQRIDELNQQYAQQYLISKENTKYQQAEDKGALVAAFSKQIETQTDTYTQGKTVSGHDSGAEEYSINENLESALRDSGYVSKGESIKLKGKTGEDSNTIVITSADGKNTREMSIKDALAFVNKEAAAEKSSNLLDNIINIQNKDAKSNRRGIGAIAGGEANVLQGALVNQIESNGELWSEDAITKDWAQAYGIVDENGEGNVERAKAIVAKSREMTENALSKINVRSTKVLGANNTLKLADNITLSQYEKVVSGLEQAYMKGGVSGSGTLNTLISGLDGEEQANISQAAANVDWSSLTAVKDFQDNLERLGVTLDYDSENYKNFISSMSKGDKVLFAAVDNFKSIRETLAQLKDITDDISLGDIISDDDYKLLVSYNAELAKYFVQTIDGYKAIESGDKIRKASTKQFNSLKDIQNYYKNLSKIGDAIKGNLSIDAIGDDLIAQINSLSGSLNTKQFQTVLDSAGVDKDSYKSIIDRFKDGTYTDADTAALQKILSKANTIKNNTQKGLYSTDAANEVYYTSDMSSLAEVTKNRDTLGEKEYEKIRKAWIAKYAEEFDISSDFFQKLSKNLGFNDEKAYKQLLFLEKYQDLIKAMESDSQNLTGQARADALKEQNEQLKEAKKYLSDNLQAEKEELGISANINDYTSLYLEYKKQEGHLTDEEQAKWDKLLEDAQEMSETTEQITENLIESVTAIVDAQTEMSEVQKSWNEFQTKYYNNGKIKSGFELQDELSVAARSELFKKNSALNLEDIKTYREAISKLENMRDFFAGDENTRATYQKQIDEYQKELQSALQAEIDNINELYQTWSDGWDKITDKCERYTSKLETLNDIYDKQISLMKVQDKNFFSAEILTKQADNLKGIIAATQLQYTNDLKHFTEATTETEKNAAKEALDSSAAAYLSAVENYYEKLKSNFSEIVNNIYTQAGISDANERWERASAYNDQYLNAADAQLNINKLQRNYKSAIDNASSLNAQTQLRVKMEEELNKLQANRNKLTQYEVDRANAVYELTLKQIALEESQRNASKMKLTRDSNGNLTYAFVQDQDISAKAQEEFEQAQNNLFNIDNDETKAQIDKYYQYQSQAQSALAEAAAAGDKERFKELEEYYYGDNGLITNLQNSLSKAQINLTESFKNIFPKDDINALSTYAQAVNIGVESLEKFKDGLDDAYDNFETAFNTFVKKEGDLQTALSKTSELLDTLIRDINSDTYKQDVETIAIELEKLVELLKNPPTELNINGKEKVPQEDQIQKMLETVNGTKGFLEDINRKPSQENLPTTGKVISESFVPKISDIYNGFYDPSSSNYFNAITNKKEEPDLIQNITITPNFPNATSTKDIIEAINGLGDQLFQHAGITKR